MGSCQPITILVDDLNGPGLVVVDGDYVWFTDADTTGETTLERVPVGGGDVDLLATVPESCMGLGHDITGLYCMTNDGTVYARRPATADAMIVATGGATGGTLALDGSWVWFTVQGSDLPDASFSTAPPTDIVRIRESGLDEQVIAPLPEWYPGSPLAVSGGDAFAGAGYSLVVARSGSDSATTLAADSLIVTGVSLDSLRRIHNRRSFTRDPLFFQQKAAPGARRSATPSDRK